jgi:hypothetical protein
MHIAAALLANAAGFRDGLIDISGAGWEYYELHGDAGTISGQICGTLAFDREELPASYDVELVVTAGPGGRELATGAMTLESHRLIVPFAMPFVGIVRANDSHITFALSDTNGPLVNITLPVHAADE